MIEVKVDTLEEIAYNRFNNLPVMKEDGKVDKLWVNWFNEIRRNAIRAGVGNFLRWKEIVDTMATVASKYIPHELDYVIEHKAGDEKWDKVIYASHVGNPFSNGNEIHNAYHIAYFEEKTGINADDIGFILEHGGGYGLLCKQFHGLGFSGDYTIYDIEHMSILQEYYLSMNGFEVNMNKGLACVSTVETVEKIVNSREEEKLSMFIGMWSISETPFKERKAFSDMFSEFDLFLIAFNEKFGDIDNEEYFKDIVSSDNNVKWNIVNLDHIASSNKYLIGRRCEK